MWRTAWEKGIRRLWRKESRGYREESQRGMTEGQNEREGKTQGESKREISSGKWDEEIKGKRKFEKNREKQKGGPLVSSSPPLQAGRSKPIKRRETIKKRWIAIFSSTHRPLRKEERKKGEEKRKQHISSAGLLASELKETQRHSRCWSNNSAINFLLWQAQ